LPNPNPTPLTRNLNQRAIIPDRLHPHPSGIELHTLKMPCPFVLHDQPTIAHLYALTVHCVTGMHQKCRPQP
jgi:hypothetical protein